MKSASFRPVSYTHLDVYKRQGFFGMLLCTVGLDPTNGIPRFITYKQTGLL